MMNRAGVLNQPTCELAGRASVRVLKNAHSDMHCFIHGQLCVNKMLLTLCVFSVRLLCIVREGWKDVPETTSSVYLVSGQK